MRPSPLVALAVPLAACGAPCDEDYVVLGGDAIDDAIVADAVASFQQEVTLNFCLSNITLQPADWPMFRGAYGGRYHRLTDRISVLGGDRTALPLYVRHELCHAVVDEHPTLLDEPSLDRVPLPDDPYGNFSRLRRRNEAFARLCDRSLLPLHALVRWETTCGLDTVTAAARHVLDHAFRDIPGESSPIRLGVPEQVDAPPGARFILPPSEARPGVFTFAYEHNGRTEHHDLRLTRPDDGLLGVRHHPRDLGVDVFLPLDPAGDTLQPLGSVAVGHLDSRGNGLAGFLLHHDDAPTHIDTPCLRGTLYLLAAEGLWLFEADGPTLRWWPLLAPG